MKLPVYTETREKKSFQSTAQTKTVPLFIFFFTGLNQTAFEF